jgi:hypothetical protein
LRTAKAWRLGAVGLAVAAACGGGRAIDRTPAPSASASPAMVTSTRVDPPDAALDLFAAKEAGASDCVPEVVNDGDAAEAVLSNGGDKLSICIAYHSGAVVEARSGRACYEVSLASGSYDRIGPFVTSGAPKPFDAMATALAAHASLSGSLVVKTTTSDVSVCKSSSDCETVHLGYKPPVPGRGDDTCLPKILEQHVPADVSPDGRTVFVALHEACSGKVFAELYDVASKQRTGRFPLSARSFVERVSWVGARVMVRSCADDLRSCTVQLVDPKGAATPTKGGFANATVVPGVDPAGLDPYAFHAKDDVWAIVDRLGAAVAFVHADSGAVEPAISLAPAPDVDVPIRAGTRSAPSSQLYLLYAGSARIVLVDLGTLQVAQTLSAPICGQRL